MKFYRCIPGNNRSGGGRVYLTCLQTFKPTGEPAPTANGECCNISDRSDPLLQTPCLVGAGSPTIIAENPQSHKPAPTRRQIANLPDTILGIKPKKPGFCRF